MASQRPFCWHWRIDRESARLRLIEQLDRVSLGNHAFCENRGIDASHPLVGLRDRFQDRRRFLGGVGIERDHHAACVARENLNDNFGPDAQRLADKLVLGEAIGWWRKIDIDVRPETPLVDSDASYVAKLLCRLHGKDRQRTGIGESFARTQEREFMFGIGIGAKMID